MSIKTGEYEEMAREKIMPTDEQAHQLLDSMNNVHRDRNGMYYTFGILECTIDDYHSYI